MSRFTGITVLVVVVSCLVEPTCCDAQILPINAASTNSATLTGESSVIPFSSGMLGDFMPRIQNLQLGFQYFFGDKVRSGQLNADYLLPVNIGDNGVFFGEARGNYWNFGNKPTGGASNRVDLSIGGGYRKILSDKLLVGINGFYDTSRLFNNWYSSGGAGLEMAANIGTTDAVDLNANWYGDVFSSTDILNAFRNKGGSYDIEAGYSHALFNSEYDLRLKFAGYQFDTGNNVYGYRTGADLTTRNGMFMLRYEYGNDRINGSWNNVGAFVNIGFQMENIIKGETPFTMPEPIFRSPRNLNRMLAQTVKRDWNQQYAPGRAALAAATVSPSGGPFTRTIVLGNIPIADNRYNIDPVVNFPDIQNFTTFTIEFSSSPPSGAPSGNLFFSLRTDGGGNSNAYDITGKSVTYLKSTDPTLFSVSGRTYFNQLRIYNVYQVWTSATVTLTWQ